LFPLSKFISSINYYSYHSYSTSTNVTSNHRTSSLPTTSVIISSFVRHFSPSSSITYTIEPIRKMRKIITCTSHLSFLLGNNVIWKHHILGLFNRVCLVTYGSDVEKEYSSFKIMVKHHINPILNYHFISHLDKIELNEIIIIVSNTIVYIVMSLLNLILMKSVMVGSLTRIIFFVLVSNSI
jgi:hypothetical protein